jgi:hypothetical protein
VVAPMPNVSMRKTGFRRSELDGPKSQATPVKAFALPYPSENRRPSSPRPLDFSEG